MTVDDKVELLLSKLRKPRDGESKASDVSRLLRAYKHEEYDYLWCRSIVLYREFAQSLISAGQFSQGHNLALEGMVRHGPDAMLKYLRALALARMGVSSKADRLVGELLEVTDPRLKAEALTLAGRLQKNWYLRAADGKDVERKRAMGRRAAEAARYYETAYGLLPQYYPAINAATMYMAAGDLGRAREWAATTLSITSSEARRAGDYWLPASTGEAHLIRNEWDQAEACYREAIRICGSSLGDLASMRQNIGLLHRRVGIHESVLDLFRLGTVVAFAGETVENPLRSGTGRAARPALRPDLEDLVRAEIAARLDARNARIGYCCPRAGCDIIFAEEMLRRGGELHLVLPFNRDDFFTECVNFGMGDKSPWHHRCSRLMESAGGTPVTVHYATAGRYMQDDVLFDFLNEFTQGLAIGHAGLVGVEVIGIVAFDPTQEQTHPGACARFLGTWKKTLKDGELLDLGALGELAAAGAAAPAVADRRIRPPLPAADEAADGREVKAMLFADVKNFSSLSDEESPQFFLTFTSILKEVIDTSPRQPVFCNTWGDGLYVVFDAVRDAADFATRLLDRVERIAWRELGLPAGMDVRIGMHVGPVFRHRDPILGRDNFYGSHVNRAARIEPITTPGCAFVSEQFAAALALEPQSDFVASRVGIEQLAKGYDTCPIYCLSRG